MESAAEVRRRGPGRPPKTRTESPRITIRTAANRFDIDLERKPEGMSYQWIATTILGKDNREGLIAMQQNGWTPVPNYRHPELSGVTDEKDPAYNKPLERGGQMLHERPQEITDEVHDMEYRDAQEQMETQLERVAAKSRSAQQNSAKGVTRISRRHVPITDGDD